jgi:hypothetical protein
MRGRLKEYIGACDNEQEELMGDSSRALWALGQIFDDTELTYASTALIDEILMRTKNMVRTPGVFLPTGDSSADDDLQVTAVDNDSVTIEAGVAIDSLGQLIEVATQQTLAISPGDWAVIIKWAYSDGTAGTFETGYGPGYTRRSRSYTISTTAWPNTDATAVLLARVIADGVNPVVVTDSRDEALLHWSKINYTNYKLGLASCILAQGIPAVRLDQGAGAGYFLTYETPASSGASVTVAAGYGLTTSADIVKLLAGTVLAVTNDNTYHKVAVVPSSTFGAVSTLSLVADSATGGFYVARVKRNGTTLTVEDIRTKLWMRSMTDAAVLPATPIRLRASWGFENSQRQRGVLDGIPQSGHLQGVIEPVWIKVKMGDGGFCIVDPGSQYNVIGTINEVGAWTVNEWAGSWLILGGRHYEIVSNTATTLTLATLIPSYLVFPCAFEIVPGGSLNVWQLQSKWQTVPVVGGEVAECLAVRSPADEGIAGYYTIKTNNTWTTAQIFQALEQQQGGVNYENGVAGREIIWHNLPAAVPYRIRVQSRGGPTAEFWSPWSEYVIIQPLCTAAVRTLLTPGAGLIRIEPNPGFIKVAVDWSAGAAPVKAAAADYFAGLEVTYTEGESQSGQSLLSKNPAATPVPCSPWDSISTRTGSQISVLATDTCLTIPTESLCKVRMVLRVLLRDGTVSAAKEIGYESGAVICVAPRGVVDGQGTVPMSVDSLISTGGSGSALSGIAIVPFASFIPEINATVPTWQTVDGYAFSEYYGEIGGGIPDVHSRVVGLRATAKSAATNNWFVRVTVSGIGVADKVYTLSMLAGETSGWLPIDEVLYLKEHNAVLVQAQVVGGGPNVVTWVNVALVTRYEAQSAIPLA